MNALEAVFLAVESMLCTQYIDTTVKAQAYKTFRQKKSKDRTRYVASELATEFLILYRTCRFAETEQLFNDACLVLLTRTTRDEASENNASNTKNTEGIQDGVDDVDDIARLVAIDKRANCD